MRPNTEEKQTIQTDEYFPIFLRKVKNGLFGRHYCIVRLYKKFISSIYRLLFDFFVFPYIQTYYTCAFLQEISC